MTGAVFVFTGLAGLERHTDCLAPEKDTPSSGTFFHLGPEEPFRFPIWMVRLALADVPDE
jgi:hypothetical protein